MLTIRHPRRPAGRAIPASLLLALVLGACGSAAAAPSQGPVAAATPKPTPTAVPGDPGTGGEPGGGGAGVDPGSGTGSGGSTGGGTTPGGGGGIVFPIPGDPGADPVWGPEPQVVTAAPGLANPHPMNVQGVRAVSDDDAVVAELRWWSGVAPCYALDSVQIQTDDAARTIKLTVIEGSGPGEVACIDIAVLKATFVDLGDLASGRWTISVDGDAPAITLER
jgi:hypothetical protein